MQFNQLLARLFSIVKSERNAIFFPSPRRRHALNYRLDGQTTILLAQTGWPLRPSPLKDKLIHAGTGTPVKDGEIKKKPKY